MVCSLESPAPQGQDVAAFPAITTRECSLSPDTRGLRDQEAGGKR